MKFFAKLKASVSLTFFLYQGMCNDTEKFYGKMTAKKNCLFLDIDTDSYIIKIEMS